MVGSVARLFAWVLACASAFAACSTEGALGAGEIRDLGARDAGDAVEVGTTGPSSAAPDGGDIGPAQDAGRGDASATGSPCTGLLASMLSATIVPPYSLAGLDVVRGANPKGLTFDEANADGCAVKSPALTDGYATATWGGDRGVTVQYNVESGVLYHTSVGTDYQGKIEFRSPPASRYGAHAYEMGISRLLRDGVDMPIDWSDPSSAPWADELVVALVATFAPDSIVGVPPCYESATCLIVGDDGSGMGIFGARDLSFYVLFEAGTNRIVGFYNSWKGGRADCSTPLAAHAVMDSSPIIDAEGGLLSIGGLRIERPAPDGATRQIADATLCGGFAVTAEDPGYGAIAWGRDGEVELEYNATTQIAYKLTAKAGYLGALENADPKRGDFTVKIGEIAKDGAPVAIDPTSRVSVTALSNAFSGVDDTDCVASGNCVLTPDNGRDHAEIELVPSKVHIVFPRTTPTAPDAIYVLWPKGK